MCIRDRLTANTGCSPKLAASMPRQMTLAGVGIIQRIFSTGERGYQTLSCGLACAADGVLGKAGSQLREASLAQGQYHQRGKVFSWTWHLSVGTRTRDSWRVWCLPGTSEVCALAHTET